jgi:hypothetical protein
MRTPRARSRSGFALVIVTLFLLLFLALWGQAARQVGSMIRVEEARSRRIARDAARLPSATAMAQALAALEVGYPPSSPFTCAVLATNGSSFAVTFARDDANAGQWTVRVEPTTDGSLTALDPANFSATAP